MNTDTQRITALEAEIGDLKRRDARREAEHVSLLATYTETTASRDKLRRDLELDCKMLGDAFDNRIVELTQQIARHGGGEEAGLAQAVGEFAKDLGPLIRSALDAQELRIMQRVAGRLDQMLDLHGKVVALVAQQAA